MILLVSLALAVWHLTLLRDDGSNFNAVAASSDRIAIAALIMIVIYLIGAVIFLFWLRRAYGNLDALHARRRYGKGWSIGAWFVPILNLFRPKQIANDIWRGSGEGNGCAGAPRDDRAGGDRGGGDPRRSARDPPREQGHAPPGGASGADPRAR